MFERFTEQAREVVINAQEEARLLKHNYIGTEHLLLGLLHGPSMAEKVLREDLDVHHGKILATVTRLVGHGEEVTVGQIPFTPRAKKVLELALREALSLGHNHIGAEHILLGLVRENKGVAARILMDFDADAAKVRDRVIGRLMRLPRVRVEWPPRLMQAVDDYLAATNRLLDLLDGDAIPVADLAADTILALEAVTTLRTVVSDLALPGRAETG